MNGEQAFIEIIIIIGRLFRAWWWLVLPFLLYKPFTFLWLWRRRQLWYKKQNRVLLEIKIPREMLKSIKAMDQVMASLHGFHDVVTWRQKWIEGQFQLSMSLEIVSKGGEIHFYIRGQKEYQNFIEANIHSEYPEVEIFKVDDYTKDVPRNIPNKEWDLWGADFINSEEEFLPIKTYPKFETETDKEEEKVDPLTMLLEGMASLKPGEYLWFQIIIRPVLGRDKPWKKEGREFADKLAKRPTKGTPKTILRESMDLLITGPTTEEVKKPETFPPEFQLTPGEKERLAAVEEKLNKFGYDCNIRFIYLGKRDVFFKPNVRLAFAFSKAVSTGNLGGLKPWKKTITKTDSVPFWFLDEQTTYLKKRRLFRRYIERASPMYPVKGKTYILNTEELATLFHFPGEMVSPVPGVSRVKAKKRGAPAELPVE